MACSERRITTIGSPWPPALALLVGAALLPLLPRRARGLLFIASGAAALWQVFALPAGAELQLAYLDWQLTPLAVDATSRVFGIIFALACILGGIYAWELDDVMQQSAALVYAGGALGVTFAGDLFSLLVGWELMALGSTALVWARRTPEAGAAGIRYILVHFAGGSVLLGGIVLHVAEAGSFAIPAGGFDPAAATLAHWLILIGVALNTAIPPLHAWLPDAYPRATITGAVFLSAFTTKSAVYVLVRLFTGWDILLPAGVIMALYGVVYAVLANDIREILAYHIISQVGYMVAGVGLGTALAINGTCAHAFSHILYKACLFMGCGIVLQTTGRSKLTELGGFAHRQRLVVWLFMIGAFSISGFPLFNGFISKSIIISAAGEAYVYWAFLLLLLASVGTFLHTGLKIPYFTWFGEDQGIEPEPTPRCMLLALALVAGLCTLFGVAPDLLYRYLPHPELHGLAPHPGATPAELSKYGPWRPFTQAHIAESIQLLAMTFVGFWLLRGKLAGVPKIALDVDWFYRRPARLAWTIGVSWPNRALETARGLLARLVASVSARATNPLQALRLSGPERPISSDLDRPSLTSGLTVALLTMVLVLYWLLGL